MIKNSETELKTIERLFSNMRHWDLDPVSSRGTVGPTHLPQFSIVDELWTVSMDERTETQTILPAETEQLVMKQKQLKGFEKI